MHFSFSNVIMFATFFVALFTYIYRKKRSNHSWLATVGYFSIIRFTYTQADAPVSDASRVLPRLSP